MIPSRARSMGRSRFGPARSKLGPAFLIGLVVALGLRAAPAWADGWTIQCADCPKQFQDMADHSLQLDTAGNPHLAYGYDHLYYARYDGMAWHYETADTAPGVGSYASLALDAAGRPHIGYMDWLNWEVRYAYRDTNGWHVQRVESASGEYSGDTEIGLDTAGRPHIVYYASAVGALKHAYHDGVEWQTEEVDSGGMFGHVSLAVDGDGHFHIGYLDYTSDSVKYAYQDAGGWQIAIVDSGEDLGYHVSLALDASGFPHLSYQDWTNSKLKYAYEDGAGWHVSVVDGAGFVVSDSALALDMVGRPHISYQAAVYPDAVLKYAYQDTTGWHFQTLDNETGTGYDSSISIDGANSPWISYVDRVRSTLKLAHWDATLKTWHTEAVDSAATVGQYGSLALDAAGQPRVSYYDSTYEAGLNLKYAYQDLASLWHAETADTGGTDTWVGKYSSLALDTAGYPHVSYYDETNTALKYAYQDVAGWHTATIDSAGIVGLYTSLALDGADRPHISYYDMTTEQVKYAYQDAGGMWHIEIVNPGDPRMATDTSLALNSAVQPSISFAASELQYAYRDGSGWHVEAAGLTSGTDCSLALDAEGWPHIGLAGYHSLGYVHKDSGGWHVETVEAGLDVGQYPSLALSTAGRTLISYYDGDKGDLRYAYREQGSQAWHTMAVDQEGDVGQYTSLAVDNQDNPIISYYDATTSDLMVAAGHAQPDLSESSKQASSPHTVPGKRLTYTLRVANSGLLPAVFSLTDPLPPHTQYVPGSAWASGGDISDQEGISWTGEIEGGASLTATFAVTVDGTLTQPLTILNIAALVGDPDGPRLLQAATTVNGFAVYLPVIVRR
jgi:uncharacterized repeat protein (TIGR01451 family)